MMLKRVCLTTGMFLAVLAFSLIFNTSVTFAESEVPYVEPSHCPIEVPEDADLECGYLVAPENYAEPNGRLIRMPYVILHSTGPNPDPTPLLYTAGGPGYSSMSTVGGWARSPLLENRDIIIFEQRGNLYAQPALECDIVTSINDTGSSCLEQFQSQGIDLTSYTTSSMTEDIEALRRALDIDSWNLFGTSFSTRLMQLLMVRYPEGIRSVILESVSLLHESRFFYDLEHASRVLKVMFADCAADPDCAAAYPNLEERFYSLVAELNAKPVELEFTDFDGNPFTYYVDGAKMINWMVGDAFYDPPRPPFKTAYLPLLIDLVSKGNIEILRPWAREDILDLVSGSNMAYGLFFAVTCQEDFLDITDEQIQTQVDAYPELDGYSRYRLEIEICRKWDLPRRPFLVDNLISSEIPTLVLAGRYDPVTPPEWSRSVAENLENAYYFEFRSSGHNIGSGLPCYDQIRAAFLNSPSSPPDATCMNDLPAPQFILPDEGIYMPDYFTSYDDIDIGNPNRGKPVLEVFTGISMAIFVAEIVFVIVLVVRILLSGTEKKERVKEWNLSLHGIAVLSAVLSIVTVLVSSKVLQENSNIKEWLLLLFGLPGSDPMVTVLGVLGLLQVAFTAGMLLISVFLWLRKRGSLFNRLIFSLVALAVSLFSYFIVKWDILNIALSWFGWVG
jgi:pimeloyl-ACP methyl ester carboxylesterase